jgi:hypothetical protein
LQDSSIPGISLEVNGVAFISHTLNHHEEIIRNRHHISPPERAHIFSMMGRGGSVVKSLPSKMNPRQIYLVVEFVQEFG